MAFHDHLIQAFRALTPAPLALRAAERPPRLALEWHLGEDDRPRSRWTHARD